MEPLTRARILIVDDQTSTVRLLERLLTTGGYSNIHATTDPRRTAEMVDRLAPDLVLLDLHMPDVDGFEVMQSLAPRVAVDRFLPILVVTADSTLESRQHALSAGARDFLQKPFDAVEALLRIRNLLLTRFLYLQLEREKDGLERTVKERTRKLEAVPNEILDRLARAAEDRDDNTGEHARRVGWLAGQIAEALGRPQRECELVARAATLHDVGKIGIPDAVLLKEGTLAADEMAVMQDHTTIGARILSGSRSELLRLAETIALHHHERWAGGGYPTGLVGAAIPLAARMTHVADAFDAMTHPRRYRRVLTEDEALAVIREEAGKEFDPDVVEAFLAIRTGAQSSLSAE
ncbi:MAG: response regulator [Luteitalea sp.]|nr:response regulator [Luteitalea sp.]